MALSDKQRELDRIKWEKSSRLGFDACGSFDFCKCCNKSYENPCEKAHNKFYNLETTEEHELVLNDVAKNDEFVVENEVTKKPTNAKKSTSKKSTTKTKTTKTAKKSKKSTTKKTTKKTVSKTTKKVTK